MFLINSTAEAWDMTQKGSISLQFLLCQPIASFNHLMFKEIILILTHLLHDCMKTANPNVCLLANGGIESPCLTVILQKLWKVSRVAMLLTCGVGSSMLGFEVEYIHGEANPLDEVIANLAKV